MYFVCVCVVEEREREIKRGVKEFRGKKRLLDYYEEKDSSGEEGSWEEHGIGWDCIDKTACT